MEWKKSSPELVDLFQTVMPGEPAVQRKMFGYPAAFVNGNMFMSLFQEEMILRLSEKDREELLKVAGAKVFAPMAGRPMREYVSVPAAILDDRKALLSWVSRALDYGMSLKPKSKAAKTKAPLGTKSR